MNYPVAFQNLINNLKKLPGIGSKSAERMAYDILAMDEMKTKELAEAITQVNTIARCPICHNLSDGDLCEICANENRDHKVLCVVHSPKDVFAFEKMKEYNGIYHVLDGYISPNKNIGYEDINLPSLLKRVKEESISEVILATDLTVEGEITAMYISKLLNTTKDVKVTRLAHGLPMGAQLDYADEMTLFRAFSNRKEVK